MDEIKEYLDAEDIDLVVFDDELTPSQLKISNASLSAR